MTGAAALLLAGTVMAASSEVRLKTSDGWSLAARYSAGRGKGAPGVVLLHGLAAGKDEWLPLEAELARRGVATLAVDLREHGDSERRGAAPDWGELWRDAEAGWRALVKRGHRPVGLAGASLGANAALDAAGRLGAVRFVALLSPGLDYQGLKADLALPALGPRPILLAASKGDPYAWRSADVLRRIRKAVRMSVDVVEAPAGHGAQMFKDRASLEAIADWIARKDHAPHP